MLNKKSIAAAELKKQKEFIRSHLNDPAETHFIYNTLINKFTDQVKDRYISLILGSDSFGEPIINEKVESVLAKERGFVNVKDFIIDTDKKNFIVKKYNISYKNLIHTLNKEIKIKDYKITIRAILDTAVFKSKHYVNNSHIDLKSIKKILEVNKLMQIYEDVLEFLIYHEKVSHEAREWKWRN